MGKRKKLHSNTPKRKRVRKEKDLPLYKVTLSICQYGQAKPDEFTIEVGAESFYELCNVGHAVCYNWVKNDNRLIRSLAVIKIEEKLSGKVFDLNDLQSPKMPYIISGNEIPTDLQSTGLLGKIKKSLQGLLDKVSLFKKNEAVA